ncbi:MAG: ABC transporter ATP-binding protein [Bacteroidales bacterium]|nr:ABC transporter ATP-binding protein [Bacteroidales bacterium]
MKKAINGIDFNINDGEIFGFLGPSGAGKTTTQRIIVGLLRNYSGSVEVMGLERRKWGKDFFEKIGVVFDFPNLYEKLTAYENLDLFGSYYRKNMKNKEELLDSVGLLPDRDKRVENYSKGMKMRLNFIRSIIHDPDLLFFDEPTSGLDPVNAKIIRNMILELKKRGKTIFLTTHNMTEADYLCDRVAFIIEGKVPVIDSPAELKLKHGRKTVEIVYYPGNTTDTANTDTGQAVENVTNISNIHSTGSDNINPKNKNYLKAQFSLNGIGKNKQFLDILSRYEIRTMHTQEATLEDIFIKLTGRELQ